MLTDTHQCTLMQCWSIVEHDLELRAAIKLQVLWRRKTADAKTRKRHMATAVIARCIQARMWRIRNKRRTKGAKVAVEWLQLIKHLTHHKQISRLKVSARMWLGLYLLCVGEEGGGRGGGGGCRGGNSS